MIFKHSLFRVFGNVCFADDIVTNPFNICEKYHIIVEKHFLTAFLSMDSPFPNLQKTERVCSPAL